MHSISTLRLDTKLLDTSASYLRRAYEAQRALFEAQPQPVQRFLESQSLALARLLTQDTGQISFHLPNEVIYVGPKPDVIMSIPIEQREQKVSRITGRMRRQNLQGALDERLAMLEASQDKGVAIGAALVRYTTAISMVRSLLPSGRSVSYKTGPGEEIPNQPVVDEKEALSHLNPRSEDAHSDQELADMLVPYVPEARRFYLPQWVAFDEEGRLLINSIREARAHIASMQAFMRILRAAASLAPYILADTEYQQKRYGMMGQLVNQGRALAHFETDEIIQGIWQRVNQSKLNRGLSLSLPYFDDQDMELKNLDFVIIPAGRIMFVPAFLVLAVYEAQAKVIRDDQMSPSTRQHLLAELNALEKAFAIRANNDKEIDTV